MRAIRILGYLIFFGCGIYLYIVSMFFYQALWGGAGLWGAILLPPLAELFPIVVWIVAGQFPWQLFLIWGIGWIGMVMVGVSSQEK